MIRTRHAGKILLISRQGPTKGEDVFDLKELQAQQGLTGRSGKLSPNVHSEKKHRWRLAKVCWPYAVGTGRGASSTEVNTADVSELQAVKGLGAVL